MSQRCYTCGRYSPLGEPLLHYPLCKVGEQPKGPTAFSDSFGTHELTNPSAPEVVAWQREDGSFNFITPDTKATGMPRHFAKFSIPLVRQSAYDTRAEAIWRLSKKLDVMELARVIGHRDLRSLLIYYNASAEEMADRL